MIPMNWTRTALSAVLALSLAGVAPSAKLADKKGMTLEVAKQVAAAAEATAAQNKWTMAIVILDDGGNLVYLAKMDDTQIASIEVAVQKAKSAVEFKRPTKAFEDQLVGGRNAILKIPGAMPVEGGIPLMVDGKVVGAIGVSGGTSAQDGQAAASGAESLAKILGAK
jgi:glc operon protein GlcG